MNEMAYREEMERSLKQKLDWKRQDRELEEDFKQSIAASVAHKLEKLEIEMQQKYESRLRKAEKEKQELYNILGHLKKRNQMLHVELVTLERQTDHLRQLDQAKIRRLKNDLFELQTRLLKLKYKFRYFIQQGQATS